MMTTRVVFVENILSASDRLAAENRARLAAAEVFAVNFMLSPGAGKTSLILRSIEALSPRRCLGAVRHAQSEPAVDPSLETVSIHAPPDQMTGSSCERKLGLNGG